MKTIRIVPQNGGYCVVTRYPNGRADVEWFETEVEAIAYHDAQVAQTGATPLYWHERSGRYMTVPLD